MKKATYTALNNLLKIAKIELDRANKGDDSAISDLEITINDLSVIAAEAADEAGNN